MRTYTIEVEVEDPTHHYNTEYFSDLATVAARTVQVALAGPGGPELEVTGVRVTRYTASEVDGRGGVITRAELPTPEADDTFGGGGRA
jgi:hypothetical protein